ncbi:hypothetical protein KM043_001898 [Ampulex compressa]|nr:hypothetical protein KM043_001898 [Ampulex compressa]
MFEAKADYRVNGDSKFVKRTNTKQVWLWERIRMNEWTFSLLLFVISLIIVLGKLYTNYGSFFHGQNKNRYVPMQVSLFSNIFSAFDISAMPDLYMLNTKELGRTSEKYLNISSEYEEAVANVISSFYIRYEWFIKAAVSGLLMMCFTWFIIYKDSSIPGINPPSPFSPSKTRVAQSSRMQMNYLVGALNGILIFIYMCL